jgi:hypothetical protein
MSVFGLFTSERCNASVELREQGSNQQAARLQAL